MVTKRRRVGLLFGNNPQWIGGTYYMMNLVSALCTLPDDQQPVLIILTNTPEEFGMMKGTGYPYLEQLQEAVHYTFPDRIINKFSRALTGKNWINKKYKDDQFDFVFPFYNSYSISSITKRLYWIPDFQVNYYPQFFSASEKNARIQNNLQIAESIYPVVFSSDDSRNDFFKFYPINQKDRKTYVIRFAVSHPDYQSLDRKTINAKFGIEGPYFFCPNQFWIHKNQILVLKALGVLKRKGINMLVVFTGKENDPRNPDYFAQLKAMAAEFNIESNIRFLGFIDRKDQLKLMEGSLAVIQPSLFEGWSTVVEDAKAMNQFVILSDIPVHREQMVENVSFFDPSKETELAQKMIEFWNVPTVKKKSDYQHNIRKFATDFMDILNTTPCH